MAAMPAPLERYAYPKGVSGNPGGRPAGARNRIQGNFLNRLAEDFDNHGKRAIEAAREEDPMGYVKMIASLLPKQVEPAKALEELTDDQLTAGIDFLRSQLAGRALEGSGDAQEAITVEVVRTVPEAT
jgi:hypothetical protein